MTKTIIALSLLLCFTLTKILPISEPLNVTNQTSVVVTKSASTNNIRSTIQVSTIPQPVINTKVPVNQSIVVQKAPLPALNETQPQPINTIAKIPGGPVIKVNKNINFKPFPQLQPGQTLLKAVTPQYKFKDGIITGVSSATLNDIKATAVVVPKDEAVSTKDVDVVVPQKDAIVATKDGSTVSVKDSVVVPKKGGLVSVKDTVVAPKDITVLIEEKMKKDIIGGQGVLKSSSTPNKDQVRSYIWSWMASPLGTGLQNSNTLDNQGVMTDSKQLKCYLKIFNYSNPTEDLLNSDQSMDVLYPGSFIQGKKIDSGAQILQKLPISTIYRYPIRIGGNGNFIPRWSDSSQAADVHRTIKQAIGNSSGFYSSDVYLKLVNSSQLHSLLVTLNFNAKITKALDISGGFTGNWTTKKNKFFVTMLQGIADFYPDKMVSDGSLINDAVGVFLKQSFTLQQAQTIQNFGYWGSGNIPCYINQVTYGRLMVVSVDENQKTRTLYAQLQASLSGIGSINMSTTMTQMFQDSSTKVFSVGPFSPVQVADLKAGNWTNFFTEIPANSQTIQSIRPIAFRIQDFKGQNVKVSNRLQYEQVQCQTKPSKNIKVQLADVYDSATLSIKRSGQADFVDYGSVGGGTSPIWDITTSLTSGDNDELRVSNQGDRPNLLSRWQRKTRLIIWVDNNVVYDYKNQCKGCHSQNDAFRCRIDKYSGSVVCDSK